MHQMFPWGARGSKESLKQISAQYNKIGGRKHTILLLDPTVQLWTFSYQKYHQNFTFWPKYQTSRKCTKCSNEGQGGHRRVPSRFQLNTTRLEGENTILPLDPTVQLWTFSIKNITKNLTVWPKYQTRRKCTKCSHEGQGGHRRVHSRFQLNTTRLEGENTFSFKTLTVQLWTFSYQKYHQNFTFWPKYQTSRKCTKCSHEGQGGHRRVPSKFQLNTTRLEVENIRFSF